MCYLYGLLQLEEARRLKNGDGVPECWKSENARTNDLWPFSDFQGKWYVQVPSFFSKSPAAYS
jgi:hypothetical protein